MSLESLVNAARQAIQKGAFFKQALLVARTLLTAEHVSEDELERRFKICEACEFSKLTSEGELYCGQCGCSTVQDKHKLLNKLRYERMADGSSVCPEDLI